MTSAAVAHALDALEHSGAKGGWNDFDNEPTPAFASAFGASKDGTHVIVKMTPEQALRFVDMIAEELD